MTDVDGKGLKQQMKAADRAGSTTAVIIGDDEIASNSVTIKDLNDGSQRNVPADKLVEELGK
jgi:histidyl-tRNA synthetase